MHWGCGSVTLQWKKTIQPTTACFQSMAYIDTQQTSWSALTYWSLPYIIRVLNTPQKTWLNRWFTHIWNHRMEVLNIEMGLMRQQCALWPCHLPINCRHFISTRKRVPVLQDLTGHLECLDCIPSIHSPSNQPQYVKVELSKWRVMLFFPNLCRP